MNNSTRRTVLAMAAALATAVAWPAHADAFPTNPIKLVVPYPPGGASDVTARLVADKMQASLKVPVVVENRPGANGNLAADLVARAPADGYTLLLANVGPNAISQSIYPNLTYDTVKSFAAVSQTTLVPIVLVAGPAMPAKNFPELLDELKRNPGKHTYASAGNGSSNHLTGAMFTNMAGVKAVHVPYKGDTPALTDVMAGHVSMMFTTAVAAMPFVKSGKLRVLGIATNQRVPALPEVPTIAEAGIKGFDSSSWGGIVAPAGTPAPVIQLLHKHATAALQQPDVKSKLADLGAVLVASSPDDFQKFIRSETDKWGQVAKSNSIRAD
ncbi:MAG TPA: tripartite tricarboxylate transporter substrate binding protein [Ramlibacter sp.]|nr:tripartite tricarboxylate transporter substrate binding protein [Ramlibacter sp.]